MQTLNEAQLQLLKLFEVVKAEEDLRQLRTVLVQFLAQKTVEAADKSVADKGYTEQDISEWKNEHFRKK